jgi:hypothetical protein
MLKTLTFLKRREGMSPAEFRKYYEESHAPFGIKFMLPEARRYVRRYVVSLTDPISSRQEGIDFDVVTEVWVDDKEALDRMIARLCRPEIAALIAEDEEKLFDRSRNRLVIVEEEETVVPELT